MFLVAANHPFSDFAAFTHSLILTAKKKKKKNRRKERVKHFFINHFFFLPRNWTRSWYFGLRNMDNILMKNCGEKNENKCFFSVFKTQWLWIPQEFLVLSERLLSCMPCIHYQLWLLLSVLTFLAQSPVATGQILAFQNHVTEVLWLGMTRKGRVLLPRKHH